MIENYPKEKGVLDEVSHDLMHGDRLYQAIVDKVEQLSDDQFRALSEIAKVSCLNQGITYSLYKEGRRVVYRPEIDDDALDFARQLVACNPKYAQAYVLDVCRTADGLKMLETNSINAAGFYAADLAALAAAIEDLSPS